MGKLSPASSISRAWEILSLLIVFGGLPGTGKTTLARAVAAARGAVYLRIDEIEQALRRSGALVADVGPAGYLVAYDLAESNLRLGRSIVADCVNPLAITRDHWVGVGEKIGAPVIEIEVVCSDRQVHRLRLEGRTNDVVGLRAPTWTEVLEREYETWTRERLIIDTAGRSVEQSIAEVTEKIWSVGERREELSASATGRV